MIAKGYTANFTFILILAICIVSMVNRARKGMPIPLIRRIPALDAIDEAVGRATETNRPIIFSPGTASDFNDPQTFAAFSVLGHVSAKIARNNARLIVATKVPQMQPVLEEIVRQGYMEEGVPDAFRPDDVRYLAFEQFAYASGVVGIIHREGVAVTMMIGPFWAESLIFAEAGFQAGAIQIGGTANTHQLPFMLTACDYCMLGEEIYAASAYLSNNPVARATLVVQDWGKMLVFSLILVGAILATFDSQKTLIDLLRM